MSLNIIITKGKFKGRKARVVGVYIGGRFDIKIGHQYITLTKSYFNYVD